MSFDVCIFFWEHIYGRAKVDNTKTHIFIYRESFGSLVGEIQRRLACPLRKDDTQNI